MIHVCIAWHQRQGEEVIRPAQNLQGGQNHPWIFHVEKEKLYEAKRLTQGQLANEKLKIKCQIRTGRADTKTLGKGSLSLYNFLVLIKWLPTSKRDLKAYEENVCG